MNYYDYDAFTLPTIEFVGGETQLLNFNVYNKDKDPVEIGGEAMFSVSPYTNATNPDPIIAKQMTISVGPATHVYNLLSVTLDSVDTYQLSGKFIYQISIRDNDRVEIPKQGVMYITRNNYPEFAVNNIIIDQQEPNYGG